MRPFLPLALATLVLLAGCSGSTEDGQDAADGSPDGQATDLPTALLAPVRMPAIDLGAAAGEPNIASAKDGTIYASDPSIGIWRSTDDGRTFTKMAARGITGGGDGDIVIDDAGCIHWLGLFGTGADGTEAPIPYQRSCDGGATFTDALDLSNGTGSDREWIGRSDGGVLYASWRGANETTGQNVISVVTSFDDGLTWTPMADMAPDAVGGPIVAGLEGQVFEAMTTFSDLPAMGEIQSAIQLARSFDHGRHWDVVPVFTPPQSAQVGLVGFPTSIFPVVDADDAGNLHLVFSADQRMVPSASVPKPAARYGVYLMTSQDQGQSWSEPRLLSDPAKVALMPWVAAGAEGRIAVTWYENVAGLPADVLPDAWNVFLAESIDALAPGAAFEAVQLNDAPNHIGAVCTSGTGCLAGDRSLLDFFEVAIRPSGQPIAVWTYSVAGTGVGVAAQGANLFVGGVLDGTPLR